MFSIAAINDTDSKNQWEPLAPSKEAQEFHLTQTYQEGLLQLHAGEYLKAQSLFEAVIQDPLIASAESENNASDGHLLQLRFLALKNLGNVFAQQGAVYYEKAVQCYLQAVEIDGKDIVVWNRLGTLSCALGLLNIARRAFEQGLNCSPNNWNCMEKLLEVLIAIGDEVACLAVAKLLLKRWPSHSRALLVQNVIEESCTIPFGIRGIDKLEPKHISLVFPGKRKTQNVEENENHPKKKIVQKIDLNLPEASWNALIDAILNALKPKTPNNSNECNVDSEEVGHHSDVMNKRLVNANVNFLVRNTEISEINIGSHALKMLQCPSGCGRNKDAELSAPLDCASETGRALYRDKGPVTHEVCRDGSFNDNSNERTCIMKEREVSTDEEPPQERRSTRLERLRSRKSEREESDLEKGKEHAKLLRQMLDPYIVCDSTEIKGFSSAIKYPAKIDRRTDSPNRDESDVMKFLKENTSNNGIYDVGELLLERMSVTNLQYWDGQYQLLELDKLIRHWKKDRTPCCNLFLGELYFDFALSCTEESKAPDLFNEASYYLCKVVESVALQMPFHNFLSVQNVGDMSNYSCEVGLESECGAGVKNRVDTQGSLPVASMTSAVLTGTDTSMGPLHETGQDPEIIGSGPTFDQPFWVRFHWLSGRLWTFSGERDKGLKEFQRCFSLLNSSGGSVILHYCKVDREISLERVQHELRLLEVEGLLKWSCAQMLERGEYSDLINLLSPVLLSDNERCIVQTWGVNKGHVLDTSVELTALDILISACEKANPMDLVISLKCHKRRLEIFCLAAGLEKYHYRVMWLIRPC